MSRNTDHFIGQDPWNFAQWQSKAVEVQESESVRGKMSDDTLRSKCG